MSDMVLRDASASKNGVNLLSPNLSYIQNPEIQIFFAREESSKHFNSCMIKNPVSPCGRPMVTIYSSYIVFSVWDICNDFAGGW